MQPWPKTCVLEMVTPVFTWLTTRSVAGAGTTKASLALKTGSVAEKHRTQWVTRCRRLTWALMCLAPNHMRQSTYLCAPQQRTTRWGYKLLGQLGLGVETRTVGNRPDSMGDNLPPVQLAPVAPRAVVAGDLHTCVLESRISCWGSNSDGGLERASADSR